MNAGDISFPNLGIHLHHVPWGFRVFGLQIAWYGVFVTLGMIVGFAVAIRQAKKEHVNPELVWDIIVPLILISVVGARIYYVVFFWEMYKDDPISVLNIREGGLAIYGGILAGIATCYVFTRIRKISFFQMLDILLTGVVIGQVIGRWGNFMNREVFGGYTNGLFAMRIPAVDVRARDISEELARHMTADGVNYIQVMPTFLYEGALNLIVFLAMLLYRKHKKFHGEVALIYLGGYGIVRFFIEGLRTDRLLLWHTNIAVSQLLGMLLFLFAVGAEVVIRVRMARAKAASAGETETFGLEEVRSRRKSGRKTQGEKELEERKDDPSEQNSSDEE